MLALLTTVAAHQTPLGWVRHPMPVLHSEAVAFSVCLKERNREELFRTALDVSTPGHPSYGAFLTVAQIEQMTRPAAADMSAVTEWLDEHGAAYVRSRECLQVKTTVGAASRMLTTSFHTYHRTIDGRMKLRAGAYTLPPRVEQAVEAIFGLHGVPLPPRPNPMPTAPAKVTPTVLAQTYHAGTPFVNRGGKNKQAVAYAR